MRPEPEALALGDAVGPREAPAWRSPLVSGGAELRLNSRRRRGVPGSGTSAVNVKPSQTCQRCADSVPRRQVSGLGARVPQFLLDFFRFGGSR